MRRPALISAVSVLSLAACPIAVVAQFSLAPLKSPGAKPVPGGVAPMPVTPPLLGGGGQALPPPSTPVPLSSKDSDTVTYDSGPAQYIDKDHRWMMTGGVTFVQGDANLQTQSALVNLDQDMKAHDAKSLAPVHLWNDDDDLTGTHGVIDFSTHIANIKDHITLIAKPSTKPQAAGSVRKQFKDPATITCDEIVYNYRKKTGHIPGPLTIHQKDRTVTADTAEYDGNRKTVDLRGHVHGLLKDGSVIDAPEVQIGIDEGHEWIYMPHRIHGVFSTKQKDDNKDNSDDNGKATPAPPPALPPIPENTESTPQSTPSTTSPTAPATAGPTSTEH